ncbi:MAG: YczE/YyaS/YitT family protein [Bacteroides cellulosilyticus]
MAKRELTARYLFFIAGLFVNAFGISLIIKANLGSSPISSLPYTLSLKFPVTLGQFTLLLNAVLIAGQIWLLKRDFRKEQFLQIPVAILFSFFIDCSMALLGRIHSYGLCLADSITDSWLCDTWPGSKYGGNCQCSDAIRRSLCESHHSAHGKRIRNYQDRL